MKVPRVRTLNRNNSSLAKNYVIQPVLGGYKLSSIPDGQGIKRTYVKPRRSGQLVLFRKLRPSRHGSVFYLYTMVCILQMQSVKCLYLARYKPRHVHWQESSYLTWEAKAYGCDIV
jgi:hypothetical protein